MLDFQIVKKKDFFLKINAFVEKNLKNIVLCIA
nr:hypothetical protein [Mucilaginibacter sp. X5P1]